MSLTLPPVELGAVTIAHGTASISITMPVAGAVGDYVQLIATVAPGGNLPTTITDTGGNIWTPHQAGFVLPGLGKINTFHSILTSPLSIGDTITPGWSDNSAKSVVGYKIAGVTAFDQDATNSGTGPLASLSSGILGNNNSVGLVVFWEAGGATDTGFIPDPNYAQEGQLDDVAGNALTWGWAQLPGTLPANYAPTTGGTQEYGIKLVIVHGPAIAEPTSQASGGTPSGPPLAPVKDAIQWGLTCDVKEYPSGSTAAAINLGAKSIRYFANLTDDPTLYLATTAAIKGAGLKQVITLSNNPGGTGVIAPADIPTYKTQLAARYDLLKPDIAAMDNEPDLHRNYVPMIAPGLPATAAQLADPTLALLIASHTTDALFQEAAAFVDTVHSRNGTAIVGSISSPGVRLAYLYYLMTYPGGLGKAAANQFVTNTARGNGTSLLTDLPSLFSNVPITANDPATYLHMITAYTMITGGGFKASGADYFDVHLFWPNSNVVPMFDALGWAKAAGGLPLACLACGQQDKLPLTTTAVSTLFVSAGAGIVNYFSSPKAASATQIFDPTTGTLNDRGTALQTVIGNN